MRKLIEIIMDQGGLSIKPGQSRSRTKDLLMGNKKLRQISQQINKNIKDNPGSLVITGNLANSGVFRDPETPNNPENPNHPETLNNPETPNNPETSNNPETPNHPKYP